MKDASTKMKLTVTIYNLSMVKGRTPHKSYAAPTNTMD
jgi:hypothetical protein